MHHNCCNYLKANKVKMKEQLNMHIIFESSALMLFTKNYQN